MKKNYIFLLFTIMFVGAMIAQESQKNFINYQGVARNASNDLMVNETMEVSIGIKFGSASASAVYEENHNITTNGNGVFSLLIGNGSSTTGNYNTLAWGSGATFITVSINGDIVGTTEMMAVPYAISAGNMTNPSADEVLYDNSTSGLTAMTTQAAIDELVTSSSVDADADPANELQTLSFDAATNELSLSDGGTVIIPSGGTDADADPENEIDVTRRHGLLIGDDGIVDGLVGTADGQVAKWDAALGNWVAGNDETSSTGGSSPTGLEALDEGEGLGWRLIGKNDANYGPIGLNAFDISASDTASITRGATGDYATAMGEQTTASGIRSTAMGFGSRAIGSVSTAIGEETEASGEFAVAMGDRTLASEQSSTAFGAGTRATNTHATAMGESTLASGKSSTSTGIATKSESLGSFALGRNNIGGGDPFVWQPNDPLFEVGNGSEVVPSNALTILKNGNVGIGTNAPTSTFQVEGSILSSDLSGVGQRNVMADASGNLVIGSSSTSSSLWNEDDNGISRTSGQVGIGHQAGGDAKLFVQNALPDIRNGIRASVFNNGYKAAISASAEARGEDTNNTFGIRSSARAESSGTAWAYRGDIGGAGTGRKYGLDLIFFDGTAGEKYGVFSKGEDKNYFSGNLGIGIENPTAKLDVDGEIRLRTLSGTGQRNVMADADGNLVIGSSGGGSSLWTESGDDINFVGGKVGIGIENPVNSLHIVSDDFNPVRFESSSDDSWVSFYNSTGYVGYSGVFTGDTDMDFGTGLLNDTGKVHLTTNATPKLTVATNGDVGIGTTNPTAKLEVTGDIKTSGEINRPSTGNANMIPIAYGSIDRDGRIFVGTENFTVEQEAVGTYRIFITGEDYDFRNYIVSITRNSSTIPGFIGSNSASTLSQGYLAIRSYDLTGNLQSIPFTFVVYKP